MMMAAAIRADDIMTKVKTDRYILSDVCFSLMMDVPNPKSAKATGRFTHARISAISPMSHGDIQNGSRHMVTNLSPIEMTRSPMLVTSPWMIVLRIFAM